MKEKYKTGKENRARKIAVEIPGWAWVVI